MDTNEEKVQDVNATTENVVNEEVTEVPAETSVEEVPAVNETVEEVPVAAEVPAETPVAETVAATPVAPEMPNLVPAPKKKKGKGLVWTIILIILIAALGVGIWFFMDKDSKKDDDKKEEKQTEIKKPKKNKKASNDITLNISLSDYDLFFLKEENAEKNLAYSPLSIKYALLMLNEGTAGDSHDQISGIVGDYAPNKYTNSSNMSFANALFINKLYKDNLADSYVNTLKSKYSAEVILDDFKSTSTINNWVKDKTLGLIEELLSDIDSDFQFVLVNALGIDMEWKNTFHIKEGKDDWFVYYPHIKYQPQLVENISMGYPLMTFNDIKDKSFNSVKFTASIVNYDIIKDLGEESIRQTVGDEYTKWLENGACGDPKDEPDKDTYLTKYLEEIGQAAGSLDYSTDFKVYYDDNIKAFAKELKEYNGVTLEYVAIMPKNGTLKDYVTNIKSSDISTIISNLKEIKSENFEDGKITYIHGSLPIFDYDYELDLTNDLKKLGITDIFDSEKANLSKIATKQSLYISDTKHKANISLSNDGIKAAAATAIGGKGAAGCRFEYLYEVPVVDVDMTFDKPFMYLIINKDTNEVWFVGQVYEPQEWKINY